MIWRLMPAFKSARNFKLASNYIHSQSSCICIQYYNLNPSRSEHEGQITMKDNLSICSQHNNLTPSPSEHEGQIARLCQHLHSLASAVCWVHCSHTTMSCGFSCIPRTSWLIKGKLELTSAVHAMLQWALLAYKCTNTIATPCCRTEKNTDGTR